MEGDNSCILERVPLLQNSNSDQSSFRVANVEIPEKVTFEQSGENPNQNGDIENVKRKPGFTFTRLSRRSKYVLVLCTMVDFLASCAFSLLAPFYPLSAGKKGMSLTMIGFVFSVFEMVIFISSPLIGNYLTKIGPKFVYLSGIVVGGVGIILFGTLDKCPSGLPYVVISILCRSTEAVGCAALITSSFAIVSSEFPGNIGTVFGILETGGGLGFMVGPAIGGVLYQFGGYGLPFYTMGGLVLLNGILIYRFLPSQDYVETKRKGSLLTLLQNPMVIIPMGSIFLGGLGIGVLNSTLTNHLVPFGVSSAVVGLMFIIPSTLYTILAPLWGVLVDSKEIHAQLIVFGQFLLGVGYSMIGPSYFFPFLSFDMWTLVPGLMLIGSSLGCAFIPTMMCMVKGAVEIGYENNIETYALVSGLFTSVSSFGSFVGPLAGGALVDQYGFRVGYSVVACMSFAWMVVSILFFLFRYLRNRKRNYGKDIVGNDVAEGEGQCESESNIGENQCP